jgi:hypothetical protein
MLMQTFQMHKTDGLEKNLPEARMDKSNSPLAHSLSKKLSISSNKMSLQKRNSLSKHRASQLHNKDMLIS